VGNPGQQPTGCPAFAGRDNHKIRSGHDLEKCEAVFGKDHAQTREKDHAQTREGA
jgi:hypothetical protein